MMYRILLLATAFTCSLGILADHGAWAYHSYLLTVAQLRAGLEKGPAPNQKPFILIDVRSPQEHATGVIPARI